MQAKNGAVHKNSGRVSAEAVNPFESHRFICDFGLDTALTAPLGSPT
jgi:hypothetical protein